MVANASAVFHVLQLTVYEQIPPIPIRGLFTIRSRNVHSASGRQTLDVRVRQGGEGSLPCVAQCN